MRWSWYAWCVAPVTACTPLGVWVYEDPGVTISRVRVDAQARGVSPVVVALDLRNPNDFIVSTTRVELRLILDDLAIGELDRDSSVSLPKGTATVALPLTPNRATTPARLQAFESGVHRFTIEGRATFKTPVGRRKVRFAQTGHLAFGPGLPPRVEGGTGAAP
jgi:LEA14-like dessication related protein